ncbi:FAD-binding domain-containing protein [Acaromyces ingoldii]|uniref:FAD-binding domain-containing protein n=1 Tax=Acaromyces ingoldii TaxID=215250 RepID=A0A316YGT4_9BASI|nr:FAD-binding domain-containing protein [Acaromyces ingoldii]PWN88351.1 FAD-binding domain-containing protein [Acaromyces ingoldii]
MMLSAFALIACCLASVVLGAPYSNFAQHHLPPTLLSSRHILRARSLTDLKDNAALTDCLLSSRLNVIDPARNDSSMYWDAAQSDNLAFHFHPYAIVYPRSTQEVSAAVICAAKNGNVAVAARSGGHSFGGFGSGGQDGSLIVDLVRLGDIHSDSAKGVANVGPGARLGDVVKGLWHSGKRGMPHGTCPPVGVGGHALCGGFGPTSRLWGMTTDNILEAEVVLSNGTVVVANKDNHEELFWGLRGAGSFFGIVTRFTFKTYDVAGPWVFLEYRWTSSLKTVADTVKTIEAIQAFAMSESNPAELGFHLQIQQPNMGDPPGGTVSMHMRGAFRGSLATFNGTVAQALQAELDRRGLPLVPDGVRTDEVDYLRLMEDWDDFGKADDKLDTLAERLRHNQFLARTSLTMDNTKALSTAAVDNVVQLLWQRAKASTSTENWAWNVYMELFGGSHARHLDKELVEASSMQQRDALWLIQTSVGMMPNTPFNIEARNLLQQIDAKWKQSLANDGIVEKSYSCYVDLSLGDEEWKEAYYGKEALERITILKHRYDPIDLFRNPHRIPRIDDKKTLSKIGGDAGDNYVAVSHPLPR